MIWKATCTIGTGGQSSRGKRVEPLHLRVGVVEGEQREPARDLEREAASRAAPRRAGRRCAAARRARSRTAPPARRASPAASRATCLRGEVARERLEQRRRRRRPRSAIASAARWNGCAGSRSSMTGVDAGHRERRSPRRRRAACAATCVRQAGLNIAAIGSMSDGAARAVEREAGRRVHPGVRERDEEAPRPRR